MFQQRHTIENEMGLVKISDASLDVMEQFFTFLYTGQFSNKRKEGTDEPIWVEMLPELVYVADKV